ncbi:LLM class flavin-dependent oxidoreductase [Methylobacterium sp. NEAU 140]|uniref:LLM class flavin-dependent oxidoreductase n=1 Tax=Methylobacterium sp. NEAU 140 TaxID=3064945 RepID=UPI00273575AC|nr:LLM class flavin-dependent oxidoreductase [Methylobacterium sp. NEAU 140]MDP4026593.1 LLM class flavin-dependent oxidoreductase [Methylobacterium sp. NEAU 140]
MKISLGVYPNQKPSEVIASAKLAEELGFDTLWMLDSHLLFREVYTMFGAIGAATSRIRLGTAVTNPLTRHPTVTASAFATLAELTEGRATLGISVGDSALKAMNLEIAKMKELADTVRRCRALLDGEEVAFGEGELAKLHHTGRHVPIYVAATGPKMLALTGEIGDGCILMNGVAPDLIQAAIDLLQAGEREAKRPVGTTKTVVWAACHPDPEAVKYNVARAILRNIPGPISDLTRQVAAEVKKEYNYEEHGSAEAHFASLVPTELVERFAFSHSPEHIASQIDALEKIGVDEVVLAIPFAPNITPRDEVMRQLAPMIFRKRV